ncbi:hypothetical protein cyc_05757 [Cyclospora cayetanensis]|uniref:Uncharacterized protein n=1 Tax=Cyclospora cayetanensis TaxID=88456 RepID=A0A1D3D105_9EIME|nr:hypothetical protein cyc_05757 [Cyclospora cayetanensis]
MAFRRRCYHHSRSSNTSGVVLVKSRSGAGIPSQAFAPQRQASQESIASEAADRSGEGGAAFDDSQPSTASDSGTVGQAAVARASFLRRSSRADAFLEEPSSHASLELFSASSSSVRGAAATAAGKDQALFLVCRGVLPSCSLLESASSHTTRVVHAAEVAKSQVHQCVMHGLPGSWLLPTSIGSVLSNGEKDAGRLAAEAVAAALQQLVGGLQR